MKPYLKTSFSSLYNGDCEEVLRKIIEEGISFDKVLTSPPYNIRRDLEDVKYDVWKDGIPNDDYINWVIRLFALFDKGMRKDGCVLWNMSYGGENSELLPLCVSAIIERTNFTLADILVWKKDGAYPNNVSPNKVTRVCEFVFVLCRKSEYLTFKTNKKVVSYRNTGQAVYENIANWFYAPNGEATELNHSTFSKEFVDELLRRYVCKGDIVLDPFSGTGTTMLACEARGVENICIELSEDQCRYAKSKAEKPNQIKLI